MRAPTGPRAQVELGSGARSVPRACAAARFAAGLGLVAAVLALGAPPAAAKGGPGAAAAGGSVVEVASAPGNGPQGLGPLALGPPGHETPGNGNGNGNGSGNGDGGGSGNGNGGPTPEGPTPPEVSEPDVEVVDPPVAVPLELPFVVPSLVLPNGVSPAAGATSEPPAGRASVADGGGAGGARGGVAPPPGEGDDIAPDAPVIPALLAPAAPGGPDAASTPLAPIVSGNGVGWGILAVVVAAAVAGFVVRHATLRGAVKEAQLTATRDPLTGLANRRLFDEFLGREIARSRRKAAPVAVLLVDLDGFKRVNDTRGHAAGDEVLRTVATILRTRVRSSDLPTRFGGDEFAVLLPECGADDALRIGEELCRQVEDAVGPDVTASIGVAAVPEQAVDGEELLTAADAALYRAKAEGRNRALLGVAAAPVDGVDA